ncbi:MAG: GspE/PulE family protein [Spirochaetaceae bacterium]|jgi:general secretion pathway protein E/type IV pilus assembly protein PilB|nr:GspE/PulE family protein [Spirochaetaceae bacterium]
MRKFNLQPEFCSANKVVILESDDEHVSFGMLDTNDGALKARLEKAYSGFACSFTAIGTDELNLHLSRIYVDSDVGSSLPSLPQSERSQFHSSTSIDELSEAPVINLLNSIFLEAVTKRASDIHIESGTEGGVVRFRIDGVLLLNRTVSPERFSALSTRLKLLANLNVMETRRPQDGHIEIETGQYRLDVRISIVPTIWGESIVLRLLNRSDIPLDLDSLGFSKQNGEKIETILRFSSGLVLVTGPTGSGKSTTLTAILKTLNTTALKIISIEDPVEYRVPGIAHIQTNDELGLTFDTLLRRVFRQDPDIIMVGEIRDAETAELAVRASLTGHLVFATLHTSTAIESISRLENMGIPAYLLSAVLKAVIAQRLLRKICTECKGKSYSGKACPHCSGTGYYGRTAVAEIITVNEEIQDAITGGETSTGIKKLLQKQGFMNITEDANAKVAEGITDIKELHRELGAT